MIKRHLLNKLREHLTVKDEITLLTGARQTGKTTLLKILANELKEKNIPYLYLNLDFEEDYKMLKSQREFVSYLKLEFGNKYAVVFIDEIQRKENAGLFLKGIFDRNLPYKLVITGSGSIDLKERISESLVGRKKSFILHPVDFVEFLNYKTNYKYEDKLDKYLEIKKEEAFLLLKEYLSFGGYPKVILKQTIDEKRDYIREIFQSYVEKDVSQLIGLKYPNIFSDMLRLLSHNEGLILNFSSLASDLKISIHTVKNYFWYAEKTYIINSIPAYFKNISSEIKKQRIPYFEDLGLANFLRHQFAYLTKPEDLGLKFQTLVFHILRDYCQKNDYKLTYWRTTNGAEIDFVIDKFTDITPIEVKFKHLKTPTATKALYSFIRKYQPKEAYLINLNLNKTIKISNTNLHFIPWHQFIIKFAIHFD